MRFQNYINENLDYSSLPTTEIEKVADLLINNCSQYFKEIFPCYLYRGMEINNRLYGMGTVRKDRRPKDTPLEIHNWLDEWFLEHFGWKARSEGLFVSTKEYVGLYGDKYLIFPKGNFRYVFSPEVHDLMNVCLNVAEYHTSVQGSAKEVFNSLYPEQYEAVKRDLFKELDEAEYTNRGLKEFILGKGRGQFSVSRTDREVMINCNEYYFIKLGTKFEDELTKLLNKKLKNNVVLPPTYSK